MKLGPFDVPGYYVGDCRALLREIPDESVNCVVSSPPYWALRDYGLPPVVWGGEPACAHRFGDSIRIHRGGPPGAGVMLQGGRSIVCAHSAVKDINAGAYCEACGAWRGQLGLEPTPSEFVEHIVEVFREVRRVLREDGTCWVNLGDSYAASSTSNHNRGKATPAFNGRGKRQVTAAGAENPPRRRPSDGLKPKDLVGIPWMVAFALRADGWWLRSEVIWSKPNPMPEAVKDRPTKAHEQLFLLTKSANYVYDADAIKEPVSGTAHPRGHGVNPKASLGFRVKQNPSFSAAVNELVETRNKRSVWTITTEPTPDAHFACFPSKLVEPCILAGSRFGGVVLDPFGGSGTTARVAESLGRYWILFDLNPDYAAIAKRKTAQAGLLPLSWVTS